MISFPMKRRGPNRSLDKSGSMGKRKNSFEMNLPFFIRMEQFSQLYFMISDGELERKILPHLSPVF